MQEVKIEGLEQIDRLVKKLAQAPEVFQDARRRAFEEAAEEAKRIVDYSIAALLRGDVGKIKRWQESHVGSRGGYAAVRPKADTWTEPTKKKGNQYAVGAVTNAIVSGHEFPSPSGRKRYKSRITIPYQRVQSSPFYDNAKPLVEALAKKTAEKIASDLISHLEE